MRTLILSFLISISAWASSSDPAVVSAVDFNKYAGVWYEIAHAPNFFQKGCVRSTAEYQVIDSTSVTVHNICFTEDGKTRDISGVARVKDTTAPAKLKVKFNFFQRGDYWITHLDSQYQWAVVSAPKKKSLFILSRTAPMDPLVLSRLLLKLKIQGFDTNNLVFDKY